MKTRDPRRTGGQAAADGPADTIAEGSDAAAAMRRRREAGWRLPPLVSGHRDPFDTLTGLPISDAGDCCRGLFGANGTWQSCCGQGAA